MFRLCNVIVVTGSSKISIREIRELASAAERMECCSMREYLSFWSRFSVVMG